jgi:hypothetical protein
VQGEGNQSRFEWFGSGDGNGKQMQASSTTGRSIRPGTAVPGSVLVSDMGDGSLLLEDWRDEPSAYLSLADAVPFRRELARSLGSVEPTHRHSQGESR